MLITRNLRNLLMASAVVLCATTAVAQQTAPAPVLAPVMIPIPGTDMSMINRFNDPLVQARVAKSEGKSVEAYKQMHQMPSVDGRLKDH